MKFILNRGLYLLGLLVLIQIYKCVKFSYGTLSISPKPNALDILYGYCPSQDSFTINDNKTEATINQNIKRDINTKEENITKDKV